MNKKEIISSIFEIEDIKYKLNSSTFYVELLNTLSKTTYSLATMKYASPSTIRKYLKEIWPDKPSTTAKYDVWLLLKYEYKQCKHCEEVLSLSEFHTNNSKSDGLSTYCKSCQNDLSAVTSSARQAKYKASKLLRTPSWITFEELDLISKMYLECPEGYHVDHIIPLQGTNVSGLHTLNNLQYLTASENCRKRNKFIE